MAFSMMQTSPYAMANAASRRLEEADQAIKALSDPMTLAIEHGIQFFTFAAAGYTSGRFSNPKLGPIPYELAVALPMYAVSLLTLTKGGGGVPGGLVAGRIADQVGTIMLGTYIFKFAAGYGKSHIPATTTATAPTAASKGATGANFSRRELVGAGANFTRREVVGAAGMGALSAAEAARLSR